MDIFHYWKQSLVMLTSNVQYGFWSELWSAFKKAVYTLIVRCWWLILLFLLLSLIPGINVIAAIFFGVLLATYIIWATKSNIDFNSKRDFRTVFWSIIKVGALFIVGSILLLIVSLLRLKVNWLDIYSLDRKVISQMVMQYHINNRPLSKQLN